ncbi:S8 family serine peptidase [Candidatus Saccharibacteria bacterium]|nr:S8 family serine peptidase [Candidatus Saccharibacteria bacterium]
MSVKRGVGVIIVSVPILLILVTVAIVLNNREIVEEGWTNIAEVSEEFLDKYFDDYEEMRKDADPENILMVTSKTRPGTYGAVKVVEAPNYLYMLSYVDSAERDVAFENLKADGMTVEKNQMYSLMDEVPANKEPVEYGLMSEEQIYQAMGTGEESDSYLSWGVYAMALNKLHEEMDELSSLPTVTVAVIDSGMDLSAFNTYFPDRTLLSYCVTACEGEISDGVTNKHGTHVGGIVVESTLSNVQLMAIKVNSDTEGHSWNSDVITGINYAVSQGVDVINMSLGGPGYDTSMDNALQAAENAKVISVASAGNENVSTLYYPASYDNTLSIAALRLCDSSEECVLEKADFSNYGAKIDFAAPGDLILGINGYYMSGTSQASPHMAAVLANLKSLNKDLTRANAKELLKDYSVDFGDEGWDEYYGWGMPNFHYIPGFCSDYDCDNYGVFASHWGYNLDGLTDALSAGTMGFLITDNYLIVASDAGPVMAISEKDGTYTRVQAETTDYDNMRVFYFNETDPASTIHMAFVGDVDLNGTINILDLAKVKRSILLTTNKNYQALSDKGRAIADVTGDGNVNVLDLAKIKRSILLTTNKNYSPLSW